MATSRQVKFIFGYENTDFARSIVFSDVPASVTAASIKSKTKELNISLLGGTAGGLSTFFLSDAGDHFTGITDAIIIADEETAIDISGGE